MPISMLLEKKLTVNGRQIACRVTGQPGSANDGLPYMLMLQGGPGVSCESIFNRHEVYASAFGSDASKHPHFIYFDQLGVGESDQPQTKDEEYTVRNFTHIAAGVVEAVKAELHIDKIDLRIIGESFGGMVAMCMPAAKEAWTDDDSDIRLNQILTLAGSAVPITEDHLLKFLAKNYSTHPEYTSMCDAIRKMLRGEIRDREDYVKNVALKIAPLYSDVDAQAAEGLAGKLFSSHPMAALKFAELIYPVIHLKLLHKMIVSLGAFNFDLLNHFMKTNYDDISIPDLVRRHADVYSRVNICCLGASQDYICEAHYHAEPTAAALPDHIALIVLHAKHAFMRDYPQFARGLIKFMFADGDVNNPDFVSDPALLETVRVPDGFKRTQSSCLSLGDLRRSVPTNSNRLFKLPAADGDDVTTSSTSSNTNAM